MVAADITKTTLIKYTNVRIRINQHVSLKNIYQIKANKYLNHDKYTGHQYGKTHRSLCDSYNKEKRVK